MGLIRLCGAETAYAFSRTGGAGALEIPRGAVADIRRDPNTVGCSFKTREFKDERYACRFGRDHRQRGSGVAYN